MTIIEHATKIHYEIVALNNTIDNLEQENKMLREKLEAQS